jgi:phage gpG-like protein
MPKDFDVHVEGLRDFRRDLKKTDAEAAKALQKELKEAVGRVSIEAAATAPRKSGALARSYRPFTRGNIAGVRSPLPYAGVIEYGGSISPKGTPITIRKFEPITRAVERRKDAIVEDIGDAIESAAKRAGWND